MKKETKTKTKNFNVELILSSLFTLFVFCFFAFIYPNHLYFQEQLQLFLLTPEFLCSHLSLPGGASAYLGGFLVQFFALPFVGAAVVVALVLLLQQSLKYLLKLLGLSQSFYPLSYFPAINYCMLLCDEFYPLSGLVGLSLAMLFCLLFLKIKTEGLRTWLLFPFYALLFYITGGASMVGLSVVLIVELVTVIKNKPVTSPMSQYIGSLLRKKQIWFLVGAILFAASLPLFVQKYFLLQTTPMAFMSEFYYNINTFIPLALVFVFLMVPLVLLLPLLLQKLKFAKKTFFVYTQIALLALFSYYGLTKWMNPNAEKIMGIDYMVKNGDWDGIIKDQQTKQTKNKLSLAMLNLALAHKGQLANSMFSFQQHGAAGLFLPFEKENVGPMLGSEIYFFLGFVNAAQHFAFESMETTANHNKTVRSLKRLAETNLINGKYEVAKKYLGILKNTLFYRSWAEETEKYLYHDELVAQHPTWGSIRKTRLQSDFFINYKNIDDDLIQILKEHPNNRTVYEYLMAYYLVEKDLKKFMEYAPLMKNMGYREIPQAFEEAIYYSLSLKSQHPEADTTYWIGNATKTRMAEYANIYTSYPNAQDMLRDRYSNTYWYYFHFR